VGCGRLQRQCIRQCQPSSCEKEGSTVSLYEDRQVSRRAVLRGVAASLVCAPAIVRATSLMSVRGLMVPIGRLNWELDHPGKPWPWPSVLQCWAYEAFEGCAKAGDTETDFWVNGSRVREPELGRIVTHIRRYGLLDPRCHSYPG
jgi:hypothetical protein